MMMIPRRNDFDLFDDIFKDPFFTNNESKIMKTDIKEKKDKYIIDIDLPGYEKVAAYVVLSVCACSNVPTKEASPAAVILFVSTEVSPAPARAVRMLLTALCASEAAVT